MLEVSKPSYIFLMIKLNALSQSSKQVPTAYLLLPNFLMIAFFTLPWVPDSECGTQGIYTFDTHFLACQLPRKFACLETFLFYFSDKLCKEASQKVYKYQIISDYLCNAIKVIVNLCRLYFGMTLYFE